MFTIIEQGGFQFKVTEGDTISVPLIDAVEGTEVAIDKVLFVEKDGAVTLGAPHVAGASVKATVVSHGKGPKVLIFKKKRRKDYKRKNGHRQDFTSLKITTISA
jgi:large subunit ribosomal protein L21